MGKYVEAAQRRTGRRMTRLMTSRDDVTSGQGACPFSGAMHSDEAVCVLDSLTADPRVSTRLALNLIDSSSSGLQFLRPRVPQNAASPLLSTGGSSSPPRYRKST